MAKCQRSSPGNEDFTPKEEHLNKIITKSRLVKGFITKYILNTRTVIDDLYLKRVAFGEKDKSKLHRTILTVGGTGVGKSNLINAMVTYMLGVESTDRVWLEITETIKPQTGSETKPVTVYDIYPEQSLCSLTIIDVYGFGDTEDPREESNVASGLLELFKSKDGVPEIDAVCLVIPSNTRRLTETQLHRLDDILSLFSRDVEDNIVVFITHDDKQKSTNAIKAIKDAKVPSAQTGHGEPVYFQFNSFHCENFKEEKILDDYEASWNLFKKNMESFLSFMEESKTINTTQSEVLLTTYKQLASSIFNLKDQIILADFKIQELEQTNEALQELDKGDKDNFECEVNEPYKEKQPLPYNWWYAQTTNATCCKICEENCHYPGCRWAIHPSWCSVMSNEKCTVCTNKCHYTDHFREGEIYVVKTRKVKNTLEELKKKYETKSGDIKYLVCILQNEIKYQERKKIRLAEECYQSMCKLDEIASKQDYLLIIQNIDFLILKMTETDKPEEVQKLKELKKRAEAKSQNRLGVLGWIF